MAADQRIALAGPAAEEGRAGRGRWTSCAPAPTWTCCSAPTPGPARTAPDRTAPDRTGSGLGAGGLPGHAARGPARCRPGSPGRVNLTIPLATLLGLAERPGEIPGLGPIDPDLARDLANAAAQNPTTTWCVTVTDEQGRAIGHGCARPEPKGHDRHREQTPGNPGRRTDATHPPGPGLRLHRQPDEDGPPGGGPPGAGGSPPGARTAGSAGHARPDRHR